MIFSLGGGGTITLTSPTINGTIATTGLTLPAVTLGGNMTVTGYAFDAGGGNAQINTTALRAGLTIQSTQDGTIGAQLKLSHVSASPAANDLPGEIYINGKNSAGEDTQYVSVQYIITSPTDGSETAQIGWWLVNAGENNSAMTLSGAGVLAVDLAGSGTPAQVDLFDEYDDALVLRQGIQQNNRELLADMGVLERKDTGSGYMMKLQPMVRLLAGGIYQTRQMLEEKVAQLESRLRLLEVG